MLFKTSEGRNWSLKPFARFISVARIKPALPYKMENMLRRKVGNLSKIPHETLDWYKWNSCREKYFYSLLNAFIC